MPTSITPFDKKRNSKLRNTVTIELPEHVLAERRKRKKALLWQGQQLQAFDRFRLVRVVQEVNNE
jgi:hypothetical protein